MKIHDGKLMVPFLIVGMICCLSTSAWSGTTTVTYDWEFSEGVWEGEPSYGYFAGNGAGFDSRVSHGTSDGAGALDYSADPTSPVFYSVNPDPVDPQFNRHILELTESPLGDTAGAFYGVLAYVENLSDGDLVSFSFSGYIPTAGGTQYVVPDAIYSESGLGPSPPGTDNFLGGLAKQPRPLGGGGWVDLRFDADLVGGGPGDPIVFNSDDATNPSNASALTLRVRGVSPLDVIPPGSPVSEYNYYVDHLTVTVTSDNPDAKITLPSLRTFPVNLPLCDFDAGGCGTSDIDALVKEIAAGTNDSSFDLNGDTMVDQADLDKWLELAGAENRPSTSPYPVADANLDGMVDASDFEAWTSNNFTATGLWTLGDFNADGFTDVSDFNEWNNNKFMSADSVSRQAPAVPEPTTTLLAVLVTIPIVWFSRGHM